jgi:helix-turn-helix protein
MPWKESSVMDERLRFVARLLEGEPMSHVCREFGISRKTGYKIFDRYKDHGLEGLTDRSRRPVHYAPSARGCHHVLGTFCYPCLRVGQGGSGGWGGIRTHERLAPLPVFKTGALNRSATHPARKIRDLGTIGGGERPMPRDRRRGQAGRAVVRYRPKRCVRRPKVPARECTA